MPGETEALTVPLAGGAAALEGLAAGPADGPPVLLLHGFPQDASAFADVLPPLAAGGLRAVALTQRGYTPRHRPREAAAYRLERLAEDVLAAADALGFARFSVVGHDWGAVLGWYLAGRHADRVATLTAVSVPHPAAFVAALTRSLQPLRSAYVPLFRASPVAEAVLGARDGLLLRRFLRAGGLDPARADAYTDRLLPDGGLRAALRWYGNAGPGMARIPRTRIPTTFVWSDGDVALDRVGAERTGDHVLADYRFVVLEGASHWIPEQHPQALAEHVLARVVG